MTAIIDLFHVLENQVSLFTCWKDARPEITEIERGATVYHRASEQIWTQSNAESVLLRLETYRQIHCTTGTWYLQHSTCVIVIFLQPYLILYNLFCEGGYFVCTGVYYFLIPIVDDIKLDISGYQLFTHLNLCVFVDLKPDSTKHIYELW